MFFFSFYILYLYIRHVVAETRHLARASSKFFPLQSDGPPKVTKAVSVSWRRRRGSQWSFSSEDLEFRLFDLRQKNYDNLYSFKDATWSRFWPRSRTNLAS